MVKKGCLLWVLVAACWAQEAPRFDPRLPVVTILREDLFAGFMANDDARLAAAERNIARLEAERPRDKAELVACKGTVALTRAARAHEAGRDADSAARLAEAKALFDEAERLAPTAFGVKAVVGGSYVALADRLPETARADAWSTAYRAYTAMWEAQKQIVDRLPLHLKGELLAGVAQSAGRTGHTEDARDFSRRILDTMPGTPYAKAVQRSAANIACQTCHDPGRLAARTAALNAAK